MIDPYYITEPAAISFSGGRTSAYMLHRVLQAHGGTLPDYVKVVFANTGKEMPQTLDFVRDCGEHWGVDIVWVELDQMQLVHDGSDGHRRKFSYTTKVVDHATASRKGEPFATLIKVRGMAPNPVARFCTADLKTRRINQYLKSIGFPKDHVQLVGLRADEMRRVMTTHNTVSEGHECYCPLYVDGVTKEHVAKFCEKQNFDLALYNDNGVSPFGNCDLCFLKNAGKKISIIKARPDLAQWWIEQEKIVDPFRNDHPSYQQMSIIATDHADFFEADDNESIPCFCGD